MAGRWILLLIGLQLLSAVLASSVEYAPLQTLRKTSKGDTVAIKRALNSAAGTTYTLNQTTLTKSWADATLFSIGVGASSSSINNSTGTEQSLELEGALTVTCTACYINGSVGGFLNITNDFNLTTAIDDISDQVSNITETALDQLADFALNLTGELVDTDFDFPAWPTLDLNFDLEEIDGFPDVHAQFEFNDLELYLELDVALSAGATYTLDLFTSQTIAGIALPGLEAGALLKVSLVLSAEAEIDISSGFHVKLDKGLLLNFELFNRDVSGITLPGGLIEFLPVTITGAGSLRALLQIEASIGFGLATPGVDFLEEFTSVSAGISAEVFAYVADLLLNIDATTDDEADCALEAVAEYTLAVGAAAGATVAVGTNQWGPAPSTMIPVWYTTLASVCAGEKTSPPTPTPTPNRPTLEERQRDEDANSELVTTTLTTTTKYAMVSCISTGLINCPVHLQSTTSAEREMTTILTVESGVDATFPASTFSTLSGAIAFGENVRTLTPTSGVPVSYVPPVAMPSPTDGSETSSNDDSSVHGDDDGGNNNKLIIGLSVGLGVPALIGVGAGLWYVFSEMNDPLEKRDLLTGHAGGSSIVKTGTHRCLSLSPRRRHTHLRWAVPKWRERRWVRAILSVSIHSRGLSSSGWETSCCRDLWRYND
ncbi:hypothetical protein BJX63DRAFT_338548 [Aspergillus granulosus]|uniref:Mid2 domain-containing protein n=1 Tax=Aspergillus granulosus TaxID=176169 RepID=A0ABR4HX85_9EURO